MTSWLAWGVLGWAANAICQGLALAAAVWLLLRGLPRTNASTRYAVWMAALLAVVAVPLAAPQVQIAAPDGVAAPAANAAGWNPAVVMLGAPGGWPLWILAAWVAVSAFKLAKVAHGYVAIERLKRRAAPLGAGIQERFAALLRALPGRRAVELRRSPDVTVPIAAGLRRPAILIPQTLLAELSGEELDQVLVHELAHIRRGDDWTNAAQKLIEAVFFFHPAVWCIGRRLNLEREVACDDWVVSMTGKARAYAACLTRLASLRLFARAPQLAPGALAKKRQISRRVEALLARRRAASPRFSRIPVTAAAPLLVVFAVMASRLAPIAVAEPAVAMPAAPGLAAPTVEMACARPPKPAEVRAPVVAAAARRRPAALPVVQVSRPAAASYVLIQEWRSTGVRNVEAGFCIFYSAGEYPSWVRIVWVSSRPARAVLNRA